MLWSRASTSAGRTVTAWEMVFKQTISHWRLLSSVLLGVLLASAILSGSVVYFDAQKELALESTLQRYSGAQLGIVGRVQRSPTSRQDMESVSAATTQALDNRIGWLAGDSFEAARSQTFFLAASGMEEEARASNQRSYFAFLPRLFESGRYGTVLPGGRLPSDQRLNAPGEPLEMEALVPVEAADLFGVGVGDRMVAITTWEEESPTVDVVISGLFTRNDPQDETWYLESTVLGAAFGASFKVMPFFLSRDAYADVLGPSFASMDSTYAWLHMVDTSRLSSRNSRRALADTRALHGDLGSLLAGYIQSTSLDNALQEYDRKIFFSKLPMFVVLILIAVVVVYYVATLSSLVVEERRGEMALLRSRGASTRQIVAVFFLEGATLAGITVAVAPLMAAAAISAMGYTPIFSDLTDGARLSVTISAWSYALSGLGGALGLAAMTIPALQASRIGVVRHRQEHARPKRLPAFQRYYVDVLMLLIAVLLFWQLTQQGSVVATDTLGEMAADQLLLAVPGIMLVASAMVLLRLFPLALGLVSRLTSQSLPAGLTMGLWQMSRNPVHYARLSLLLILAAGLGIFASSFESTLETSVEQRVLHSVGSDIRLDKLTPDLGVGPLPPSDASPDGKPGQELVDAFLEVPGVQRISAVLRTRGGEMDTPRGVGNFELLAVDADSFDRVAWFRDDYSDRSLNSLLETLGAGDPPQGLPLPADTIGFGVRLRPDRLHPTVKVVARLRDARNQHFNLNLGTLGLSDWGVLEALVRPGRMVTLSPPFSLVSIHVEETNFGRSLLAGTLLIDDVRVTTAAGVDWIVDDFRATAGWNILASSPEAISDTLRPSEEVFDDLTGSALFTWSSGSPLTPRGLYYGGQRTPLPIVANNNFLEETGHSIGDEFEVAVGLDVALVGYRVPVRVVGSVELFPTVTDLDENLIVAELTALNRYSNLGARDSGTLRLELWVSTETGGPEDEELARSLAEVPGIRVGEVQSSARDIRVQQVDPLVRAGWTALLFIAFSAVLLLSCIGVLVHAYVSFRDRRVQFALMRTVGFSLRQQMGMVWLEQLLVIVTGMALGTWMGGRLGSTIMPFLGHNDWGGRVIPPFATQVNWSALLLTYAVMLLVLAVISVGLIWRMHRISLGRVLRLGEL